MTEFMCLFAQQTSAAQNAATVGFWIGYIAGMAGGIVLYTAIISGIFHLISIAIKNQSIRFSRVFPWVLLVLFILVVISHLKSLLLP